MNGDIETVYWAIVLQFAINLSCLEANFNRKIALKNRSID